MKLYLLLFLLLIPLAYASPFQLLPNGTVVDVNNASINGSIMGAFLYNGSIYLVPVNVTENYYSNNYTNITYLNTTYQNLTCYNCSNLYMSVYNTTTNYSYSQVEIDAKLTKINADITTLINNDAKYSLKTEYDTAVSAINNLTTRVNEIDNNNNTVLWIIVIIVGFLSLVAIGIALKNAGG